MRNLMKRAMVVAVLAASGVAVAAAPAMANAQQCSRIAIHWGKGGGATYICFSGDGYYRTQLYCATNVQGTSGGAFYFGPWNHTDQNPVTGKSCPSNKYLIDAGYDLP